MAGHPMEWYARWVEERGGDIEVLRLACERGDFSEGNLRNARAYLAQQDALAQGARERASNALTERGVVATESQATTARHAFWLAVAAFVVSLIAIGLTAYDLVTRH